MKLYHGSDVEVTNIDLSRSLMRKDFGPGFYLSANLKQAENLQSIKLTDHVALHILLLYPLSNLMNSRQLIFV